MGKRNVFILDLSESREEGGGRRGRGRSFHVDGLNLNRKCAGTNGGESGAKNLEAESINITGRVSKVEDSHRAR